MQFIWTSGHSESRTIVHIERQTAAGEPTRLALCGEIQEFDRSVNAPWALGRKVCAVCERIANA